MLPAWCGWNPGVKVGVWLEQWAGEGLGVLMPFLAATCQGCLGLVRTPLEMRVGVSAAPAS